jgi:dUTP pyrophosphatase
MREDASSAFDLSHNKSAFNSSRLEAIEAVRMLPTTQNQSDETVDRAEPGRRARTVCSVRIRRLDASVELPRYGTDGSAAFDLAASEDAVIAPGEVRLVPTGLVIEVPDGMFLAIFARSSTPLKRGLMIANGVGVVDSDYCGPSDEVKIPALNFTSVPVRVAKGDRIAQGILLASPRVAWEEVGELRAGSRGGFGATGE